MPGFVCQGNYNTQGVTQKHQKSFKNILSFSVSVQRYSRSVGQPHQTNNGEYAHVFNRSTSPIL